VEWRGKYPHSEEGIEPSPNSTLGKRSHRRVSSYELQGEMEMDLK
jgi:hypothetical protein